MLPPTPIDDPRNIATSLDMEFSPFMLLSHVSRSIEWPEVLLEAAAGLQHQPMTWTNASQPSNRAHVRRSSILLSRRHVTLRRALALVMILG